MARPVLPHSHVCNPECFSAWGGTENNHCELTPVDSDEWDNVHTMVQEANASYKETIGDGLWYCRWLHPLFVPRRRDGSMQLCIAQMHKDRRPVVFAATAQKKRE